MIGVGSIVKLNSNSPVMTVTKLDRIYGKAECTYFSEVQGKFETLVVHEYCLEEIKNTVDE